MEEITLLTKEQVENLKVLKKYETEAEPTDFYIIHGGYVRKNKGNYWTKDSYHSDSKYAWYVNPNNNVIWNKKIYTVGVRPVIKLDKINTKNQKEIEYGEYPQKLVSYNKSKKLESLYNNDLLEKTKKVYTSMTENNNKKYQEYLYKENKYIRVKNIDSDKTYWIKVEPIKWIVDEKENIAISKKILTCMPFSYNNKDYEESDLKKYLQEYFIKEIQENKIDTLINIINKLYNIQKTKIDKISLPTKNQIENSTILEKTNPNLTDYDFITNNFERNPNDYWTKTSIYGNAFDVYVLYNMRDLSTWCVWMERGVCPIIPLSEISKHYENEIIINGSEIKYGEYPQSIVDKYLEEELEFLYQQNKLEKTNKIYTRMTNHETEKYQEYLYNRKKYIRLNNKNKLPENSKFSNGRDDNKNYYWIKVEPIKWIVDKKQGFAISKSILLNTVFSKKSDNNYDTSDIKKYLEEYFIKEIIPSSNIDIDKINNLINMMEEIYIKDKDERRNIYVKR